MEQTKTVVDRNDQDEVYRVTVEAEVTEQDMILPINTMFSYFYPDGEQLHTPVGQYRIIVERTDKLPGPPSEPDPAKVPTTVKGNFPLERKRGTPHNAPRENRRRWRFW